MKLLKEVREVKRESRENKKLIKRLQHEVSWHTEAEHMSSGRIYELPEEIEEEEVEEEPELFLGDIEEESP